MNSGVVFWAAGKRYWVPCTNAEDFWVRLIRFPGYPDWEPDFRWEFHHVAPD